MIAKVEMIQQWPDEDVMRVRINYYRELADLGYDEHHVQVPVIPEGGYPGKVPVDRKDYDEWIKGLPEVWQNNPCLNQFIQISIDTTKAQLKDIMREHIKRLKANYPDVVNSTLREGAKAYLDGLKINKAKIKPKSLPWKDAVAKNHILLGMEVKG